MSDGVRCSGDVNSNLPLVRKNGSRLAMVREEAQAEGTRGRKYRCADQGGLPDCGLSGVSPVEEGAGPRAAGNTWSTGNRRNLP
jgi:hypothetical protein